MSKKMVAALNEQIKKEGESSYLYLSMASWCDQEGLEGCAKFFFRQADEEHMHMMKIFNYLLEMDEQAIVPGFEKPPVEYPNVRAVFEEVYDHEQEVTQAIFKLVSLSFEEGDHSTHNFLQWYVEEQREEEALARDILGKIQLIGDVPQSLYYIDKEIEKINSSIESGN
jgi:ferritin